jgi:hypothetical protein
LEEKSKVGQQLRLRSQPSPPLLLLKKKRRRLKKKRWRKKKCPFTGMVK